MSRIQDLKCPGGMPMPCGIANLSPDVAQNCRKGNLCEIAIHYKQEQRQNENRIQVKGVLGEYQVIERK